MTLADLEAEGLSFIATAGRERGPRLAKPTQGAVRFVRERNFIRTGRVL